MSEIEDKLAKLMDEVPEIEGLIAFDGSGNVLSGQTITEADKGSICSKALMFIKSASELVSETGKGNVLGATLTTEGGYIVIWKAANLGVIALLGKEAAHSIGLISTSIKNLVFSS